MPEVRPSLSPQTREQGMPDARCTRGLACKVVRKKAHTSIQVQRRTSDIPCAMALRLIRALPGELRSVATVACERVRKLGASLAAPGPHDFAVRCGVLVCTVYTALTPQASIATRATLRDDRETSLMAARARTEDSSDLRNSQEGILDFRSTLFVTPGAGERVGSALPPRTDIGAAEAVSVKAQ